MDARLGPLQKRETAPLESFQIPEPTEAEAAQIFEYSHRLLVAAVADDMERSSALRDNTECDWWNVALTFAYLLRDGFTGRPEALELLAEIFREAEGETLG